MQSKKVIVFLLLIVHLFWSIPICVYGQDNLRPTSASESGRIEESERRANSDAEWENYFEELAEEVLLDISHSIPSLNLVGAVDFIQDQKGRILQGLQIGRNSLTRQDRQEIKYRIEVTLIQALWMMDPTHLPLQEIIVRRYLIGRRFPIYSSVSTDKPIVRVRLNEAIILLREQLVMVERTPGNFQLSQHGFRIVLRTSLTPKKLYKKVAELKRAPRRRFLKRASLTLLGIAAGVSAVGKWAHYEYATDHSFDWKSYPEILENETHLRPVWSSYQPTTDLLSCMHQWIVDPNNPERTRRSARNLRSALNELISSALSGTEAAKMDLAEITQDHFDVVIRLIQQADPNLFPRLFAVQWELARVKILLLDLLSIYAATFDVGEERAELIVRIVQNTTATNITNIGSDSFVSYILSQTKRRSRPNANATQLLNDLFHRDVGRFLRRISEDSVNISLRQKAYYELLPPYLKEFPSIGDGLFFVEVEGLLDNRGNRYPTPAAFQEGALFYQTLANGPVRPIAIEDLEAVRYARKELLPFVPYFLDSGRAHQIPTDVLAAVGLTNRMVNTFRPSYDLVGGFAMALRDAGGGERDVQSVREAPDANKGLLGKFPDVKIQDRASDWLAGRVMGASPTIGLLQIRAGRTPLNEDNVRDQNLWARWGVNHSELTNRQINGYLLDPQWNIEAGAALYEQMINKGIARQEAGEVLEMPDLRKLRNENWLVSPSRYDPILSYYGPDPILGTFLEGRHLAHFGEWMPRDYMINAVRDWGSRWFPYARILVLEAGLFDDIPAKIVGLTDTRQLDLLFRTALGQDPYLQNAALCSIRELAEDPEYQDFPARIEVARWWRDYIRRHGYPAIGSHPLKSFFPKRQEVIETLSDI